jgi:hypothetical protein
MDEETNQYCSICGNPVKAGHNYRLHGLAPAEDTEKNLAQTKAEKQARKEAVDFVFEHDPELADIGTKEQYLEYLETVFPESLIRRPVYHETKSNWFKTGKFDLDKIGETDAGYYGKGFYFSTLRFSGGYGHYEFASLLNIENPKYHVETYTVGKQILMGLTKEESRLIAVSWLEERIRTLRADLENLQNGIIAKHHDIPADADFETYWEGKRTERMVGISALLDLALEELRNIDSLVDEYYSHDGFLTSDDLSNYEEVMVRDPDQIHILGSQTDKDQFQEFVEKTKI